MSAPGSASACQPFHGPTQNLVYLLADEESRETLAIESGWGTSSIAKQAEVDGLRVKFVVSTHSHSYRTSAFDDLEAKMGAKVVAHERPPVRQDVSVEDGYPWDFGDRKKVICTPGHVEDSICL